MREECASGPKGRRMTWLIRCEDNQVQYDKSAEGPLWNLLR
jgi:hypothetical protein